MTRRIVLCADDFGHSASISKAIIDLAQRGRISAVSCMAAAPLWREHGRWLADIKDKIDVGLHLTLADEKPLTVMPRMAPGGRLPGIGPMIAKAYAGRIDRGEIEAEARAQLDAFTEVTGFAPAHIDGHLHAHVLPGIREVVLELAQSLTPTPWLRSVHDTPAAILGRGVAVPKALFIAGLGRGLKRAAAARTLRANDSFAGIYAFSADPRPYGALFGRFMREGAGRLLVQCHPAAEADASDAIGPSRVAEYKFLGGAAFPEYLAREEIALGRFAEARG